MRRQILMASLVALAVSYGGIAFAQTQNSNNDSKRGDPDAASDVREAPLAQQPPSAPYQATDAGKRNDPDAAADVREAAPAHQPPSAPYQATDAGKRNDPDAAADVREGTAH